MCAAKIQNEFADKDTQGLLFSAIYDIYMRYGLYIKRTNQINRMGNYSIFLHCRAIKKGEAFLWWKQNTKKVSFYW